VPLESLFPKFLLTSISIMIVSPTNNLHHKRPQSSTNISKKMQKEEYNRKRQAQRQASTAAKHNKQFDQFYTTRTIYTVISSVTANPVVNSGLHLSTKSITLIVTINLTNLRA
jgi:hypothetical protein